MAETYQEWKKRKYGIEPSPSSTNTSSSGSTKTTGNESYEEWKKRKAEEGTLYSDQQRAEARNFQTSWGLTQRNYNKYVTEANDFLQNVSKDYISGGKNDTAERLRSQGRDLLKWFDQYGSYFDADAYRNIVGDLQKLDSAYGDVMDFYSQFETQDAYDMWDAYSTPEKRQERYEQNQTRLEELKKQRLEMTGLMSWGTVRQDTSDIDAEIAAIEREMAMYKHGGTDADTGFYYGSKVVDYYSRYLTDPNYGQFSAEDFQNPTKDDLRYYDAMMVQSTWYQDGSGNTRNRMGDIDDPRYQIADPLGAYLQATPEDMANMHMHGDGNIQLGVLDQLLMEGYYGNWEQLDEKERGIYYTLLGTQGKEAAMKYLSEMETELNRRNMAQESELYKLAFERANGWQRLGMSAVSIPANLLGGATAFVDDLSHTVRGEDINPYSAAHQMQNYGQQVRANQAAAFDESSSWEIPWIGFSAGDLYQAAMSTADRFGGAMIGPTAYGALMGMGAASSEARRLYEMGASREQIFWGSAAAGAAEMVFEKYSIGKLIDIKDADTLGKLVLNALKQGGIEASEEGATELANLITNNLIMTSESDWAKLVESNNGNKWAAAMAAAGQIGEAAAGGFVSGLIGGTFSAAKNYAQNYRNDMDQGKAIQEGDGLQSLRDLSMAMAEKENGKAQAALRKQSDQLGKEFVYNFTRDRAAGRLYRTVQNTVAESNKEDVANALQKQGYSQKEARKIADAFYTQAVGLEVSKAQQKVIQEFGKNEDVQKIIGDLLLSSESTIAKRNQDLQNFRLDVIKNQLVKKLEESTGEKIDLEEMDTAEEIDDSAPSLAVSEDGSTKVISTGQSVNITGFAKSKDGKAMLRTDTGEVVAADDVSYANDSDALIYETIANLGAPVSNANGLLSAYKGKSADDAEIFARGIQEAFEYGRMGIPMAEMKDSAFASQLSEFQMEYAYKRGVEKAKAQKLRNRYAVKTAVKEASNAEPVMKREHKVVLTDNITEEDMNPSQKITYSFAQNIAKGIKGEIYMYSARTGEMGYYDRNNDRVYLNINATNKSEKSLMVFVMSHELVHRAEVGSPEKYEAFKDFLLEQYGKRGASVTDMIQQQINAAKDHNIKMTREQALEEVVADACQRMLLDTDAGKRLAAFGAQSEQNRTFLDNLRKWIHEFMEKMRAIFAGVNADSSLAAEEFNKFDTQVKRILADMYVDMTMEAGKNLDTIMNAYGKNTLVELTQDSEVALAQNADGSQKVFNLVTWENGGRETLVATLKREGYTQDDIDAALTIMDANYNLVKKIANEVDGNGKLAFPEQGRINEATLTTDIKDGHSVLSALVSNGDYPVNIDLLMVCKKRKAYQRVINRLCETGMIKQATVDALAIAEINKILGKYGFETACLGCFVESRRLRIQEWAETIVKEWNSEVKKRNPNAKPFGFGKGDGKLGPDEIMKLIGELESGGEKNDKGNLNLGVGSAVKRMGVLLDKVPTLRRTLTVDDLITPEGLSRLRRFDSNLFSMVKSRYGSNSPKFVQEFNPYNHELARYGKVPTQYNNLREYLYAIGGARMQSFSDFIVENWFDYTQIVADLAARKLPMHTYTKEIAMVKLFGMTGIKINMSLIPDVDKTLGKEYAGLTRNADGKLELIWADKDRNKATGGKSYMQSINAREAFALQNDPRYSSNIGTIAIGVSDMQIRMMLNDSRIRMVIPYHSSGMNPIYADMMGTSFYKDYTNVQNTTIKQIYNSKGQPVSLKLSKPQIAQLTGGFLFNDVLQNLGDARAAAEAYKEWCADSSKHTITIKGETYTAELTPKFDDFAKEPNYYKLLEDFNTYDCITEQVAPQGDVQQIYPEGFEKILRAELKDQETHRQTQAENKAFDKAMADIESYLKSHTKADTVYYAQQQGIKLSKKDSKLDAADKERLKRLQEQGVAFKLPIGEDTSTRTLLANAFDSVITNPVEKQKLQEYRQNIEKMNEQEAKLRELKSQIKELSFAKGPRDKAKIAALQEEARKTENRINTYDGILLRFEASKPLQQIVDREKAKVYSKERNKVKKAREEQRETAAKRHEVAKLMKLVLDTSEWVSGKEKSGVKVPDAIKVPYAEFLKAIELPSSKQMSEGGDPTQRDLRIAKAMTKLVNTIERVKNSQDPSKEGKDSFDMDYLDLPADFVQKFRDLTDTVTELMTSTNYVVNGLNVGSRYVVDTMSASEVKQLSKLLETFNHAIKEAGKLYNKGRFANAAELGKESMGFMDALGEIEKTSGVAEFVEWDNALPFYAFKRFGDGGQTVFKGFMDAKDKLAFLAKDIFDFQEKTWKPEEVKKWSEDVHTITTSDGSKLTLTTADAMTIYCLSRRQQGKQHLLGGGVRVVGIKKGSTKAKDTRSVLTQEDLGAIANSLTDRQKRVAEALQRFMSTTCAEWGNQISMKRFLTREFTEENYFPIESNDENMTTKDPSAQQSDLFRLLNISATKALDPNANNEVIIRNVFDVFIGHATDMAKLNAYAMPLLDYMKWLNYRERTETEEGQVIVKGVRKSMETAYGNAAKSYVLNLVKDINGRVSDGGDPSILMKWMRAAKTASVGASGRVALLQVTSYPRAALVLSPKNLALGLAKKPNISKAKKYCGIALWKSFGFYDTNISRTIEDQLKGTTNWKQKLIELSLKGAEWADAITWGALWNACEYEVAATKKYDVSSEEFNKAVAEKLREVVYRTQVVDSILTRSQIMRRKSGWAQEFSSYMSEPTLAANILMDAAFEFTMEKRRTGNAKAAWQKTGAYVGRALAVYSVGQLVSALFEGFSDAWRDDDDEEFWSKKFPDAFKKNLVLDLMPFNKIPIVSDVFEAVLAMLGKGYFSSDSLPTTGLMQAVKATDAWRKALDDNNSTTVYNATYNTVKALSTMSGVSFSGAMREIVDVWNITAGSVDTTLKIRQYRLTKDELGNELFKAITSGDTKQANSLENQFEDEAAVHTALRKALRSNDPRIREAAKYLNSDDYSSYLDIVEEIMDEGHFDRDDVIKAIRSEASALAPEEGSGVSKAQSLMTAEQFAIAVANGDNDVAKIAMDDIIATAQENGKTESEAVDSFHSSAKNALKDQYLVDTLSGTDAEKALVAYCGMDAAEAAAAVRKWEFESESGFAYGSMRQEFLDKHITAAQARDALITYGGETGDDADDIIEGWQFESQYGFAWENRAREYKDENITRNELRTALMKKGGMTSEEADIQIQVYDWEMEGYDGASFARVRDYNAYCSAQRVPVDVYLYIRKFASNTQNDIVNGKAVDYSAVKKIMAEINAQRGLTPAQKTAIAKSIGWKDSTIRKYKLW